MRRYLTALERDLVATFQNHQAQQALRAHAADRGRRYTVAFVDGRPTTPKGT